MKRIIWVYGIIAGLIVGGWLMIATAFIDHTKIENGMLYGYASMVLAFSMIFVAVKNYRDKHLDGYISFGKAFRIGLLITLIASTIYMLTWEVSFKYFVPGYMDEYTATTIDKLKQAGSSEAEIAAKTAEMKSFNEMYQKFFVRILFSYAEIVPVGLLISLICALILKKRPAAARSIPVSA